MTFKQSGLLFFLFLSLGLPACDQPTEPKDNPGADTTSHNFMWRVDTLGTYLSYVRDVAIVDENDIWAVGEFYKKHSTFDSTAGDRYNAAHWDGIKWELKKYYPQTYIDFLTGSTPDFPYEINSIWTFSADNIFMVSYAGSFVWIKNGEVKTKWIENRSGGMTKIWAKDENNIWIVGEKGLILYYNGSTFKKISYSSNADFVDIWGDDIGVVRTVAVDNYHSTIVRVTSMSATPEMFPISDTDPMIPERITSLWWKTGNSVWFPATNALFHWVQGGYIRLFINGQGTEDNRGFYVRGNSDQDLVVCGLYGQLFHYNGSTVKRWQDNDTGIEYRNCAMKGNTIVVGGSLNGYKFEEQSKAIISIGKRF